MAAILTLDVPSNGLNLANAGHGQTFAELAASAGADLITSLDQVLEQATAAGANCQLKNEFEARDCTRQSQQARKLLSQGTLRVDLDGSQFALGRYDFGKKAFPVSLRGQLASKELQRAEAKEDHSDQDEDDECPEVEAQETEHEDELALSAGATVAWQGSLRIADEDVARALRDDQNRLGGEAILRLSGIEEHVVDDPMAAMKKRAALAKLGAYLHGNYPGMVKERARKKQRCWLRMRTSWRQVVVKAKVIGLRLKLEPDGEYLVSFPPSLPRGGAKKLEKEVGGAVVGRSKQSTEPTKPPANSNSSLATTASTTPLGNAASIQKDSAGDGPSAADWLDSPKLATDT